MRSTSDQGRRDWVTLHVLAGVTVFTFALVAVLDYSYIDRTLPDGSVEAIFPIHPLIRAPLGLITACAAIWLWVRMVAYYLSGFPRNRRLIWGLALFLGVIAGALAFFWLVWRPNNRASTHASAA
jgi:hypothetical protein